MKDRALKRIREATPEERRIPEVTAMLREKALRAGATVQEIRDAEELPPLPPSPG